MANLGEIGRWGGVGEDHLILNPSNKNGDKRVFDTERGKSNEDFSFFLERSVCTRKKNIFNSTLL